MSVLVVAEHDGRTLKPATLPAVTAAAELAQATASDVHILVAGKDCRGIAEAAAQIAGIACESHRPRRECRCQVER